MSSRDASTHYLNVDLDIFSRSDLQRLVTALGRKVVVLYAGRERRAFSAHLELARVARSADAAIREFCRVIRSLGGAERKLWYSATVRDFNIGVQAAMQPHSYEIPLASDTVKAVSEVGARIVFTVYAPEKGRPEA